MAMPAPAAGPRDGAEGFAHPWEGNRRITTHGRSLRQHAARGTLINSGFLAAVASLTFVQGLVVAAFLTRRDYAIWGILVVGIGSLQWLKGSVVGEKYVQQSEDDQEHAFQKAFTFEVIMTIGLAVLMTLALPLLALVYGHWRIVAPGLVLALVVVPSAALQAPQWVFYRNMDFVPQRLLQAVDPVVGFVVTVALAIAGAGYWSLVLGALVGSVAGGLISVRRSPYPLAWRFERSAFGEYLSFSWPVTIAGAASIVIAQGALLIVNTVLGLAAVGGVALAAQIVDYTDGIDTLVSNTLYPAICAVQERTALLHETFVKSNRLALMWGMPFGVGVAVFAPQLVRFVVGERWRGAVELIQLFGISAALTQIGFNWTDYYKARGNPRPYATVNVAMMVTLLVTAIPLTKIDGLSGIGFAMLIMTVVGLIGRAYYVGRLLPGFRMWVHMLRAITPTLPATACTLGLRLATGAPSTLGGAIAELAVYVIVTLAATWLFERTLLREIVGYMRRGQTPTWTVEDPVQVGV